MNHYFINNNLKSELRSISIKIFDTSFVFYTDNGVFSKKDVDYGSKLLILEYIKNNNTPKKILDIGCGYGVIGIIIGKITSSFISMCDINKRSIHLAKMNATKNNVDSKIFESDIYSNVTDKYDIIITNPPIRAGKKVYMKILEEAKYHLEKDGELWFVIRKEQGSKTVERDISGIYDVKLIKKSKGYCVFKAKIH